MKVISVLAALAAVGLAGPAFAWGDLGHEVTAKIAYGRLTPAARAKVDALLAADSDTLTAPDFASRATWADRYRSSHRETAAWHFVDIEIDHPDLSSACFGFPPLAAGQAASAGPAQDCVVDKIELPFAEVIRLVATVRAFPTVALERRESPNRARHRPGRILVDYRSQGPNWKLSVSDDGVGMPSERARAVPGLGTSIVEALAKQLHATVQLGEPMAGTSVFIAHTQIAAIDSADAGPPAAGRLSAKACRGARQTRPAVGHHLRQGARERFRCVWLAQEETALRQFTKRGVGHSGSDDDLHRRPAIPDVVSEPNTVYRPGHPDVREQHFDFRCVSSKTIASSASLATRTVMPDLASRSASSRRTSASFSTTRIVAGLRRVNCAIGKQLPTGRLAP